MLSLVLSSLLAVALPAQAQAAEPAPVIVTVTREAGSGGRIVFDLPGSAPVWAFPESAVAAETGQPWRPASWHVVTPGVRLIRRNDLDALVLASGASRHVEIDFDLYFAGLRAAYEPAIAFSGGDAALYTGQYQIAPLADEAGLDAGEAALNLSPETLTISQPGAQLLANGRVAPHRITLTGEDQRTYVFMGSTPLVETADLAAVVDPGLPDWIEADVQRLAPAMVAWFAQRLGPGIDQRPTLFVAWNGADRDGLGIGGGALPGLITLQVSGKQALEPAPEIRQALMGMVAHEASHFWVGQGVLSENSVTEAWVHEGAADALAFLAVAAADPSTDPTYFFQIALDKCRTWLTRGPLTTAIQRGDAKANYHCGAVFNLAAGAVATRSDPHADLLTFWKTLLDRSRPAGRFNQADWLALFQEQGAPTEAADIIARLAAEGSPAPEADLARLFDMSGLAFTRDETGRLILASVERPAATSPASP